MVIEKSWNMKNMPKVMEFYQYPPENCTKFAHFVPPLRNRHKKSAFPTFSAKKYGKYKIEKRDGHRKLINSHEKVMEKSWKNILSSL